MILPVIPMSSHEIPIHIPWNPNADKSQNMWKMNVQSGQLHSHPIEYIYIYLDL